MNGWFITMIVLGALSLGMSLSKHGEPKKEKYNFWATLIGVGLQIFIVYMAVLTGF
jgi:uncharacterized membrane protein